MAQTHKNQDGFSAVETVLVIIVVVLIGVAGWLVYKNNHKKTENKTATNTTQTTTDTNKKTDPYAGWKTYTASEEKATFKYPSDWTVDSADPYAKSNDPNNTDHISLKSPDGKTHVRWSSMVTGLGHEKDDKYPYTTVVEKSAIAGTSGNFVISAVTTNDGSTFYPWIGMVNDATLAPVETGVNTLTVTFKGKNNKNPSNDNQHDSALFSTSGPGANTGTPSFKTLDEAKAYLATPDMQQAKMIIASFSY